MRKRVMYKINIVYFKYNRINILQIPSLTKHIYKKQKNIRKKKLISLLSYFFIGLN